MAPAAMYTALNSKKGQFINVDKLCAASSAPSRRRGSDTMFGPCLSAGLDPHELLQLAATGRVSQAANLLAKETVGHARMLLLRAVQACCRNNGASTLGVQESCRAGSPAHAKAVFAVLHVHRT